MPNESDSESETESTLAAYSLAEAISSDFRKHSVEIPERLEFIYFDEETKEITIKNDIIPIEEETASETESVVSFGSESGDEDDDDEFDPEMDTQDRYMFPGKMSRIIFRFCDDFRLISCLVNKPDRIVYTAIRKADDKSVVIIIAEDNMSRLRVNEVPREVRLMFRLRNHPNLAHLLGWCPVDRKRYCLIMEHYPNCNPITAAHGDMHIIQKMMKSLFVGLDHMHKNQVAHRDLAKDNIMWNPITETLTIIDFDTSAPIRPRYYRDVGRAKYDAPEKVEIIEIRKQMWQDEIRKPSIKNRNKYYTSAADMYSAAVFFWMLINEELHSPDPLELKKWTKKVIKHKKHKEFPELNLIIKMLNFDHKERITPEDALKHEFITQDIPPNKLSEEIKSNVLQLLDLTTETELDLTTETELELATETELDLTTETELHLDDESDDEKEEKTEETKN